MAFLSPLLLAGIALVAIPIALHLIMRRESQQFTFPALQFVRQRQENNRRRMQLRHWLLLVLRCALIAVLALALARPTLRATGLHGKEGAPLAVAMVVDNSLGMQYVRNNRTRLDEATRLAGELVQKFPEDAEVAIIDLGRAASGFAPDLAAAASRLDNLRPAAAARPLAEAIEDAIKQAAGEEDRRPEVFVFTDLAARAWSEDAVKQVNDALAEAPDVQLYLVNVGVELPTNAALGPLELRRSILRPGEPLHLETSVTTNLSGEPPLVELAMQNEDGEFVKRGQQIAAPSEAEKSSAAAGELPAAAPSARVAFEIADLPPGTHQGAVRLAAADPLSIDNARYFTVEVRPTAKVLLVATEPADARFVRLALAPSLPNLANRFECEVVTFAQLGEATPGDFQAVLLLDPGPLDADQWNRLWEYVSGGGGVGVFLGHNADFQAFAAEAPARLLPGKLARISRDETYLRPRRLDHPALSALARYAEALPWPVCRVFAYWQFEELSADAYIVATYANDDPAIIVRPAGRGRLLTVTTPFSDSMNPEGREPWNALTSADAAWPFVPLSLELVGYLAQDSDERLDYLAGETARIRLSPREQVSSYVLRLPDGQAETRVTSAGEPELSIGVTEELGNYRLTAGGETHKLDRGFSVNAPPEASDLTPADGDALVAALPAERVHLAADLDAILDNVEIGRAGRELYPWIISLVAIVWAAEHLLANRFYREAPMTKSQ